MLRHALARAGLVVDRLTFTNFTIFPLMLGVRTVQRMAGRVSPQRLTSDMTVPSKPVNSLLTALLSAEARALRVVNMPVGSSILCLARKPATCA
jgi:hypothetical protein